MAIASGLVCRNFMIYIMGNMHMTSMLPKGMCDRCCIPDIERDIKLLAFTREQGLRPTELSWKFPEVNRKFVSGCEPTVMYVHGWTEQYGSRSSRSIIIGFQKLGYRALMVDWSALATAPWYEAAVANTELVGKSVARWIDESDMDPSCLHVIGFSMGAEVAGEIGHHLKKGRIARITGLDPAHEKYSLPTLGRRLTSNDAMFVDVIHTDSRGQGRMGHADFFPNSGRAPQPGCAVDHLVAQQRKYEIVACSHQRAWMYFAESLHRPYAFPATAMSTTTQPTTVYMGLVTQPSARGIFYLETAPDPPYGLGDTALAVKPNGISLLSQNDL